MRGIVGGSGHVGQNLLKRLENHELVLIKNNRKILTSKKNIFFLNKDELKKKSIINKFKNKIDIFINLSCKYENKKFKDIIYLDNNITDQINIFNFCKKINVKYFINMHTNHPTNLDRYTFTKDFFKRWIERFNNRLIVINLSPDFIYGYKDNKFTHNIITSLITSNKKIHLTRCLQKRNFIHIDEVCDHLIYLIKNIKSIKRNINLNLFSDDNLSMKKYILIIIKYLKKNNNFLNVENKLNFGSLPMRKYEEINQTFKKSSFFNKMKKNSIGLEYNLIEILNKYLSK